MSIRPYGGEEAANTADESAVRALYQQLMDGWNKGSRDAFAAAFTEDGDLVAFDGTHFEGARRSPPSTSNSSTSGSRGHAWWGKSRTYGSGP